MSLTATDSGGTTRTETRQLVVRDPAGPTTSFTASPALPLVGELVTFTCTSQPSSSQSITALAWDLDDDGEFDDASGVSVTRSFAFPGRYGVALRVEQSNGNSAAGELKVPVHAGSSPPSTVPSPLLAMPSPPSAAVSTQQPAASEPTFMAPFPIVRIVGKVLARATLLRVLSVRAPRGALVHIRCLGRGCPARAVRRRSSGRQLRFRQFQRRLQAGIRLQIFVRRPGTIGKYTRFRMRAGKPPKRIDRCLFPGAKASRRCP